MVHELYDLLCLPYDNNWHVLLERLVMFFKNIFKHLISCVIKSYPLKHFLEIHE